MACSLAVWRFLLGSLFALSLVLGTFHSAELKAAWSVFQRRAAEVAAENGITSSSFASWRGMPGAPEEARADSSALSMKALMRKLGVASRDAAWVKRYGVAEARDDAFDEDAIDMEITEAQVSEKQWRLASSEKHLRLALAQADKWLSNLEEMKKLPEHRARAKRKVIQVLTHLGRFLMDRGRGDEAVTELRRGMQLAASSDPSDKAVLGHAQASLANALCTAGGLEGAAAREARELFRTAVQSLLDAQVVSSARQAGAYVAPHILEPLAADVRADFSECLHREGDLAAARSEAEEAQAIVSKSAGGYVSERLAQRLVRIRGSILHDNGHFEEAMHLYAEYLRRTETPPGGTLPELSQVVERFGVLQDFALATASMGRVDDALKSMDAVQHLQQAALDEFQLKSEKADQQFLSKANVDSPLQASLARSLVVRAELLLEQRRVAQQQSNALAKPLSTVRGLAEKAVEMLRTGGGLADRENAMNTLGNVYMSLRDTKLAEGTYEDSLQLAIKDHGMASPLVAAIYHNLAGALQARGSTSEALQLYRKALDIQMQTLGFGNPDTAGSLASLANCLELNGQHAEAAEVAARAADSARRAYPKGHWMQVEAQARLDKLTPGAAPASGFRVSTQKTEHISRNA